MIPDPLLALLLSVCKGCGHPFDWGYSFCRYCEDGNDQAPCVCVPRQDEEDR